MLRRFHVVHVVFIIPRRAGESSSWLVVPRDDAGCSWVRHSCKYARSECDPCCSATASVGRVVTAALPLRAATKRRTARRAGRGPSSRARCRTCLQRAVAKPRSHLARARCYNYVAFPLVLVVLLAVMHFIGRRRSASDVFHVVEVVRLCPPTNRQAGALAQARSACFC